MCILRIFCQRSSLENLIDRVCVKRDMKAMGPEGGNGTGPLCLEKSLPASADQGYCGYLKYCVVKILGSRTLNVFDMHDDVCIVF